MNSCDPSLSAAAVCPASSCSTDRSSAPRVPGRPLVVDYYLTAPQAPGSPRALGSHDSLRSSRSLTAFAHAAVLTSSGFPESAAPSEVPPRGVIGRSTLVGLTALVLGRSRSSCLRPTPCVFVEVSARSDARHGRLTDGHRTVGPVVSVRNRGRTSAVSLTTTFDGETGRLGGLGKGPCSPRTRTTVTRTTGGSECDLGSRSARRPEGPSRNVSRSKHRSRVTGGNEARSAASPGSGECGGFPVLV